MKKLTLFSISIFIFLIFSLPAIAEDLGHILDDKNLNLIKISNQEIPSIINLNEDKIISSQIIWQNGHPYYAIQSQEEVSEGAEIKTYKLTGNTIDAETGEVVETINNRLIKKDGKQAFEKPDELVLWAEDKFIYIYRVDPKFKSLIQQKVIFENVRPLIHFKTIDYLRKTNAPNITYKVIIKSNEGCQKNFLQNAKILSTLHSSKKNKIYIVKAKLREIKNILKNECVLKMADENGIDYFSKNTHNITNNEIVKHFKENFFVSWKDDIKNKFWMIVYNFKNFFVGLQ